MPRRLSIFVAASGNDYWGSYENAVTHEAGRIVTILSFIGPIGVTLVCICFFDFEINAEA